MLTEAHQGILFRPPQNVLTDHPEFSVVSEYKELRKIIEKSI
jgi:hypothetical protein